MKNIQEHIKRNEFKSIYLLYGAEEYLKVQYKNKLKAAMIGDGDEMNFSYFEGKDVEVNKVIEIADTLPFFSDRRLIIIQDSGLFKSSNTLADYIPNIPSSTHIVFVEKEVDKRNRLYKAVKEVGTIAEFNGVDEATLIKWVAITLKHNNKQISSRDVSYLLNKTGTNMENISTELEKLICYAMDRDVITANDIDEICTIQLTNKIFDMVNAIGNKNQGLALHLYYDLLALKEKPMSILFLITRQFNILLQVRELAKNRFDNATIAKKVGIPPFAVNKYIAQCRNFTRATLVEALQMSTDIEERVKTGRLIDKIGVELLIVTYSQK